MDISTYMTKHGLTDALLDEMAAPYERGDYASEQGEVFAGSHIDGVGKKRVTVVYSAADTQRVANIARAQGVNASQIYRDALTSYLEHVLA